MHFLHLPPSTLYLLSYTPFVTPLPVWDYWPLLLLPLCAGVSIVYKSIKCRSMSTVAREAGMIFISILIGMAVAGIILAALVRAVQWWNS
jgi:hypothetical protein